MKTSKFYLEGRSEVVEQMENLVNSAKTEERDLTDAEQTQFDELNNKAEKLNADAQRSLTWENMQKEKVASDLRSEVKDTPKEFKSYSFQEAMRQAYRGKLEGLVAEMDQEARSENPNQSFRGIAIPQSILEYRDVTTGGVSGTEVMSFTDQLEANLVLASAGANFYSGVNNMKFPIVSGISSGFVAETGGSTTAAGDVSSLTLSPKKMISIVEMSAEALTQNAGLENAIRRNLAANIASTLEKALLGAGDITSAPTSTCADAADGGATLDAAALLAMESTVLGNNVNVLGGRFAYLCNPDAMAIIKGLVQATGVSAIYDNNDKTINSYFSLVSSNVGNKTTDYDNVLFGDFSKVHIAQFGGLDILFDPYTSAGAGVGRMIATSLVDGDAVQNGSAFVEIQTAS